ncbi:MAG: hypothetical protein ACE5KJ_00555 [Candidatus Zixiibacteriota bacterium]
MNSSVFLDTTIQIGKIWGDDSYRQAIKQILDQFESKISSSYVKMEFKRGFLQYLIYMYNILVESRDFKEILARAQKLSSLASHRIGGILSALVAFFDIKELKGTKTYDRPISDELYSLMESFLRQRIQTAMTSFEVGLDSITDQTGCFLARLEPIMKGEKFDNRNPICKKQDIRCDIVNFLIENKETFKQILQVLEESPNLDQELEKMKKAVEKVLKYNAEIANRKNCWHCGDAITAIECPSEAKLFTTNMKHFQLLCSAIDKNVISP